MRLFDLELGTGDPQRVVADLETMVGYYPTDGRLREQLMLTLWSCGHATDALEAYDQYEALLAEEGRADKRLRDLRYAIGIDDRDRVRANWPRIRRPGTVPHELPGDDPDFIGRVQLVAAAEGRLVPVAGPTVPMVVISGPGGVGKTGLAVRVAHQVAARYPDGQIFVDLGGMTDAPLDAAEALAALLRSIGTSDVPANVNERAALWRTRTSERRLLLVLDDVRDEAQVSCLIPGPPGCAVLITARERLPGLSGAHHLPPLEPLLQEEALKLFKRLLANAGVDPHAEPDATLRVIELCGGFPIAVRIAAALRGHDLGRSTSELADDLAGQPIEGLTYRGLSVERAIGASYDRLDERSRLLFRAVGRLPLPMIGL